jgi:toxin YoeB
MARRSGEHPPGDFSQGGPRLSAEYKGSLHLQPEALDDLRYWVDTDRKVAAKALKLIEAARRNPFTGEGKPEPLKDLGSDTWSRRITHVDRLVYRVTSTGIDVLQARYHY